LIERTYLPRQHERGGERREERGEMREGTGGRGGRKWPPFK